MVYEYNIYCDDCQEYAELDGFIGHLNIGKIYHEHDLFIAFMMKHGGHNVVILGQSGDDLIRLYEWNYSEFKENHEE